MITYKKLDKKKGKSYENHCNYRVANIDSNISAQLLRGRCKPGKILVSEVIVMSQRAKTVSISVIGLVGLVVLLMGIFTDAYGFIVGLIIAIVCWAVSGILAKYWGVTKEKS